MFNLRKTTLLNKLILVSLISGGILFSALAIKADDSNKITAKHQSTPTQVKSIRNKPQLSPEPAITKPVKAISTPTPQPAQITSTPSPITEEKASDNSSQDIQLPANTPTPIPAVTNKVTISINSGSAFAVSVNEDSNQCDVLSTALAQGKISSLNMRYDKTFETNAIYQINGVGKENSVWWVYTVNGKSAMQGCTHVKVNNHDNVEWKYIGS